METKSNLFIEAEKHDYGKLDSEAANNLKKRYEKAVVSLVGLLADCTATMYKTSVAAKK